MMSSSCTSDTPDNPDVSRGSEMRFDVSELSRAADTNPFDRFAVYGDMKPAADNTTAPLIVFDKTTVEYRDNRWCYDDTRYWFPDYEHSFVAIHPLTVLATGNAPVYANSQLSFTYTVPTSGSGDVANRTDVADIMAATHRRLFREGDANTTTPLTFGHLMTLINFAPAFDDATPSAESYIELLTFTLAGFRTRGEFSIVPALRQSNDLTSDMVSDITGQTGVGRMTVVFSEPVRIPDDGRYVSLFDSSDAVIMLPQSLEPDTDANLTLTYTTGSDPAIKEVTLPLVGQKWVSGKSYTYRFTITETPSSTEVRFDNTSITDWEVTDVGDIDVH